MTGGEVCVIDTEPALAALRRRFRFMHMQFDAPFGPLRWEATRRHMAAGARTIVVDSMSHEHEGPGGVLEMHEQEVQRLGGRAPQLPGGRSRRPSAGR